MAEDREGNSDNGDEPKPMPVTADDPRFAPDELIACRSCKRDNPPNRIMCIYCGSDLDAADVRADAAKLTLMSPEPWEDGFTIAFIGEADLAPDVIEPAAAILRVETEMLTQLTRLNAPAPVAHLKSLAEAHALASQLTDAGFACAITGDDLLMPRKLPSRVRGIEFGEEGAVFLDFNTTSRYEFAFDDRLVLVTGAICKTRSETTAKRSKKTTNVTDSAESVSDESVLDVYPTSDVFGFRIRPSGFDFSCLGGDMQKTGEENMRILTDVLCRRFRSAHLVEVYRSAQSALDQVWPVDRQNQSSSVARGTFGGVRMQRTTLADNTVQFTRFSRLQRHLL